MYIKNKDEVQEFVSIINRKNIDTRIITPKFHESRLLINKIDKNSKAIFQYLYKPVFHNIVILVIDTKIILVLESKQENNLSKNLSKNGKQYFLYSNKSSQVQTYTLLFESCWISATIHEQNI